MGAFPLAGMQDALSIFGFLIGIIAALVAIRGGVPHVAWLATPLVALLVVIAALIEPATKIPDTLKSPFLAVHIGLALTGDAAFAVAGLVSIVFLIQERRLKPKRGSSGLRRARPRVKAARDKEHSTSALGLQHLPALEALDRVSSVLFKLGFPLMTLGMLSGAFYASEVWGKFWAWDPRNTVSLLVWILYAVMLYARLMIGWRGRKAALLTVVGVVVILVTFVGLGLAGVGMHGREYVS
jgi:cytochrome c-type biogenesis protein CcsB